LKRHGRPERIVIDGSQTNREAIVSCDTANRLQDSSRHPLKPIRIRQSRYLNNRIEQDHRRIKRWERPMLGFKSDQSARIVLGKIEMVHMMRKQQAEYAWSPEPTLAEQFNMLAAWIPRDVLCCLCDSSPSLRHVWTPAKAQEEFSGLMQRVVRV
jgi:hypothetical protein